MEITELIKGNSWGQATKRKSKNIFLASYLTIFIVLNDESQENLGQDVWSLAVRLAEIRKIHVVGGRPRRIGVN